MKFRFCGDGDCPDWVLGEILSTLSCLTSIKLRLLAAHVAKGIVGLTELPEEKILEMFPGKQDSAKTAIACIRFLLLNATRYETNESTFGEELQQLGLPKEHTTVMCRVHAEYSGQIKEYLLKNTFKLNELIDVSANVAENAIECLKLNLNIPGEEIVVIHKGEAKALLENLKEMRGVMEKYNFERTSIVEN